MLVLISLLACDADAPDADVVAESADPVAGGGADVSPVEGAWVVTNETVVADSCGMLTSGQDDPDFILTVLETGWFEVSSESNPLVFACELGGAVFECPSFIAEEIDLSPDFEMRLTVSAWSGGAFTSEDTIAAARILNVSCEGIDCPIAGKVLGITAPCAVVVDFAAAVVE